MGIRTYLKSLGGRAGNKTRSKGKVNTKKNKRAASKAVRMTGKEISDWNNSSKDLFLDEYLFAGYKMFHRHHPDDN